MNSRVHSCFFFTNLKKEVIIMINQTKHGPPLVSRDTYLDFFLNANSGALARGCPTVGGDSATG
jgi:hypothetical protein